MRPANFSQYPLPHHIIAHLSDTHLLADGALQFDAVDTTANLRTALERLTRIDPPPQALVFTGDLADRGEPAAYRQLRELVEPIAAGLGAQVIWVIGNHDERDVYADELFGTGNGAVAQPDNPVGPVGPGRAATVPTQDRVHDVDGLRVISLDTTVPGYHYGELDPEQLVWLADVLATPAPHGTLLALHHPPIPVPMVPAAGLIELRDQDALAQVLVGTDVIAILGGHFHFSSHSSFAGIPVSVAAATCYLEDPAPTDRFTSAVDAHQSINLVHIYDDRVVHTIVPVPDGPEVAGRPASVLTQLEAMSADQRRELLLAKTSSVGEHS